MNKPTFLEWSGPALEAHRNRVPTCPFALEELALEKEATFDDVYKNSSWKKKIIFKLIGLFGYLPDLAFQKEDVDMKVVEQMLKYPKLLRAVENWISDTDYKLLPQLQEAKRVFESIQRPKQHPILYRGFKINTGQQNSGIAQRYKKMQPGEKWNFTPDQPMSFSWHQGTTRAYGNIIVSANGNLAKRCLNITNEVIAAMLHIDLVDDKVDEDFQMNEQMHYFTYAESVFLPDGKPIEFTLVAKG
jgi:hypothetical protein